MNSVVPAFTNQYLSNGTGDAAEITSHAIPVVGNKAVLSVTVRNAVNLGSGPPPDLTISLQGSYDGISWLEIDTGVSVSPTGFGYETAATGAGKL